MELNEDILKRFEQNDIAENLRELQDIFQGGLCFSTSFGVEDQVITHILASGNVSASVFTLDTGRLFPETYSTWSATLDRYPVTIEAIYPREDLLQDWVSAHGPNAFYQSVELRKSCCHIRKVEPLERALAGKKVWITGIRRAQSAERQGTPILEWDETHQVVKYHPLLLWSDTAVDDFVREHNIPVNPLHARGFVSIGCAPCTRAVKPGEDFRAGRWWWEDNSKKECGLHVRAV